MNISPNPKYHYLSTKIDHKLFSQLARYTKHSNATKSKIARVALTRLMIELDGKTKEEVIKFLNTLEVS